METRQASAGLGCALIASLVAAMALYLFTAVAISEFGQSDAAGNGMAQGFAFLAMLLLWVPLSLFIILACARAKADTMIYLGAILLLIGAAAASLTAITLARRPDWLAISPYALPPLAVAFGLWMLSRKSPASTTGLVAFAVAAIAFMLPAAIGQWQWTAGADERAAEMAQAQAEYEQSQAEAERAFEARFRALGPESRLGDYMEFLSSEHAWEALTAIRALPSRTSDAARMLEDGVELHLLDRLHDFDLDARGSLCDAYRARIDARLAEANPARPDWRQVPASLRDQLDNMRWFAGRGCDLSARLRNLAAAERMLPDEWRSPGYAEEIDAIVARTVAAGEPTP
ncbi:MAG: hypothetical protein KF780_08165 [Sphingomonas sp.]|nr:hypothetical protein [Sphingomonas sp.]